MEQVPEAYETLINLPDDPVLLELVRENALEIRQLAIAPSVITPRICGLPTSITEFWNRTASFSMDSSYEKPRTNFERLVASEFNYSFRKEPDRQTNKLVVPAYNLNVEIGISVVGSKINNFLMTIEEPTSRLKVMIRKQSYAERYIVSAEDSQAYTTLDGPEMVEMLDSLTNGDFEPTNNLTTAENICAYADFLGQKYGVAQAEYRIAAQLLPDGTIADSHEGAILLVETETPRESKLAIVVQRLHDYHLLDAQVIKHFGAEYFGVSNTSDEADGVKEPADLQVVNRKIVSSGTKYSIYDIDADLLPTGKNTPVPIDSSAVEGVIDTLQQIVASGGDYFWV